MVDKGFVTALAQKFNEQRAPQDHSTQRQNCVFEDSKVAKQKQKPGFDASQHIGQFYICY